MIERIEILFAIEREPREPWIARLWMAGLFAAGLVGWAYVVGWGLTPLDFHDWTDINFPRLLFLQNALRGGEWPLHMAGSASLHGVTDRFLTLPDVITSPQSLLLLVLPIQTFAVVDVLLHYAVGFWGLVVLRRQLEWSLAVFALAALLFLFNGHILAHYGVGQFTWGSYFLFPLLAGFLMRFLDGDDSWTLLAKFAGVMFYIVLAGGQHHFTWILLLLTLMLPFCWQRKGWLIGAVAASGLLSAVRLLPPVLELQAFRGAGLVDDVVGYPSLWHLLMSLVVLRRETATFNAALPGNLWFFDSGFYEFNAYVGVAGFVVLVVGVVRWLRDASPRYAALIVPVFLMTALSIGSAYRIVRATGIPLLEGERYTSRLFSVPLFFLMVMAASAIDRWLKSAAVSAWHRALALVTLAFVAIDIGGSVRLWRPAISSSLFGRSQFDAAASAVVQRPDGAYLAVVLAGALISTVTAAVLLVMAYRERRATPAQSS